MNLSRFATPKYRWLALVFLALGLAIVIIDNTVLNVAIPYIIRDLKTSFDSLQWVVSGYALIIATILITVGRLGDLVGRKKIFLLGTVLFAVGSFIASISPSVLILFLGEAVVEAVGAAMMMTSSLSLLASEFQGRERAIAFGVWGSVAGASAAIGPLLGGYLTTYYSWRWSLRINVLVAVIAILGSIFIKESKGEGGGKFDWLGTALSAIGLFSLIFGIIEGQQYGWILPKAIFTVGSWSWPFASFSVVPISFVVALVFLTLFIVWEYKVEQKPNGHPLLRLSMFTNLSFSLSLIILLVLALGQLGIFFTMPIYLQNVLGFSAFTTGVVFLSASIAAFIAGAASGFIASRIGPRWVNAAGMVFLTAGAYLLIPSVTTSATGLSLAPALVIFGIGIGMASAQLTNIILSSVPVRLSGEASAVNSTVRQIGSSIGVAVVGVVLAGSLTMHMNTFIKTDLAIPDKAKEQVLKELRHVSIEGGTGQIARGSSSEFLGVAIKGDVNKAVVLASREALEVALYFLYGAALLALFVSLFLKESSREPEDSLPIASG